MAKIVELPDKTELEFPDNMSDADILQVVNSKFSNQPTQPQEQMPEQAALEQTAPTQTMQVQEQITAPPVADIQPRSTNPFSKDNFTWGKVAKEAVSNIPSSAGQMVSDIGSAIAHPIQTVKGIGNIGLGAAQKLIPGEQGKEQYANQVGEFFKQRYGGVENLKRTIAKDPVGVASDLSTILSGGAFAASKIPKLSKAAEIAKLAGTSLDPIRAAGMGLSAIGKGIGSAATAGLGLTSGVGSQPISQAIKAGETGSKAFLSNLRGQTDIQDVVAQAKDALNIIKQKKNADYVSKIGKTIDDPSVLDFKPIENKISNLIDEQYYKGTAKVGKETMGKVDEMVNIVGEFQSNPELHTAGGLDALKQRLSDVNIPRENRQAERFRTSLANTVKNTIVEQSPEYADTMRDYSKASDLVDNLEKTLSLGNKASTDTALRKLQSVMRDNVNTNYGKRLDLVKQLEETGNADIMNALAGQSLRSLTPRGLQSLVASGAGVGGISGLPAALATLPAFSPRIVGEGAYLSGAAKKLLKKYGAKPSDIKKAAEASYQYGRIERDKD